MQLNCLKWLLLNNICKEGKKETVDLKSYDLLISPPFQLIEGYLSLTVFLN